MLENIQDNKGHQNAIHARLEVSQTPRPLHNRVLNVAKVNFLQYQQMLVLHVLWENMQTITLKQNAEHVQQAHLQIQEESILVTHVRTEVLLIL